MRVAIKAMIARVKMFNLGLLKSGKGVTGYSILKRLEKDIGRVTSPNYV